jgi:hypothetical protein
MSDYQITHGEINENVYFDAIFTKKLLRLLRCIFLPKEHRGDGKKWAIPKKLMNFYGCYFQVDIFKHDRGKR